MNQSRSIVSWAACFVLAAASGCNMATHGLNSEGARLHSQGNYQAASSRFLQAIQADPNNPDAYYNMAANFHAVSKLTGSQQDLQQAENYYNQCLDRDPDHTDCYRGLAVLLAEKGDPDASLRLLEGWVVRSPASAEAKIELARLKDEHGDAEAARQQLLAALTLEPSNARALTALGKLREESGEYLQALAVYERSLQSNRFQPHVATRVATLQNSIGGNPILAPPGETRTVQTPGSRLRY